MRIRRPNAAELLALIALVVASSGSAVAASRYLITSPSQIKPSVLRSLAHAARGETAERSSPTVFSKPGVGFVGATVHCPAGFTDVTGGYFAGLPAGWQVVSQRGGWNGWSVVAVSHEAHPAERASLRVTAYCRSGR